MSRMLPSLSIVIPTYNRPQRLAKCLAAISRSDYPSDLFEVIVVDDGSATSLESIVAPFRKRLNLALVTQTNAGPAKARNRGVTLAQGEYIVFTDDDCEPDVKWLQAFADRLSTNGSNYMLGGCTVNRLTDNIFSEASQLLIDYLYLYYNHRSKAVSFFASNNIAVPKKQFLEVGSFDTTFPLAAGEDRELCDRWLNHGYPMQYVPQAIVYHSHYLNLAGFWRQHSNYGRGAFHFHNLRLSRQPDSIPTQKMTIEPFSFYWRLLIFPFKKTTFAKAILLSSMLSISQVANFIGFVLEKFSYKKQSQL